MTDQHSGAGATTAGPTTAPSNASPSSSLAAVAAPPPPTPAAAHPQSSSTAAPASATPADSAVLAKLTAQVKKLTEANSKYKNLLKLAKERIQQQEEELEELRPIQAKYDELLQQSAASNQASTSPDNGGEANAVVSLDDSLLIEKQSMAAGGAFTNISRVCQRVKVPKTSTAGGRDGNTNTGSEEIWALIEFEVQPLHHNEGMAVSNNNNNTAAIRHTKQWKRFETESQVQDYIRRDTGEPLTLPPFSLTPEQSLNVVQQAKLEVAAITEEFRRFRVKSELARKQADTHIRDLQMAQKQSAAQRIIDSSSSSSGGGGDRAGGGGGGGGNGVNRHHSHHHQQQQHRSANGSHSPPSTSSSSSSRLVDVSQLEKLRAELTSQEQYWKDAYNTLLAENNVLKSSGSEALLASQWRQRYESSQQEKETLQLKLEQLKNSEDAHNTNYEAKYRDLKESFRLYRKKAKELFDTTTAGGGGTGGGGDGTSSDATLLLRAAMADGSADAKLSYLRNLMVNYLTADADVKSHMEGAIGTLLQFNNDDVARIQKKRAENESWLFY
ncbi:hypothetical protein ACA910_015946 [Epithemia clementina (nom. ined.)]